MESTTRFKTRGDAEREAQKMVEGLQTFFHEIEFSAPGCETSIEKLEYLRERYPGFDKLELETQKSLAKKFVWPMKDINPPERPVIP